MELYWLLVAGVMGVIVYKLAEHWKESENSHKDNLSRWANEKNAVQYDARDESGSVTKEQDARGSSPDVNVQEGQATVISAKKTDVEKHIVWKCPT